MELNLLLNDDRNESTKRYMSVQKKVFFDVFLHSITKNVFPTFVQLSNHQKHTYFYIVSSKNYYNIFLI